MAPEDGTIAPYLDALPEERRAVVSTVRAAILDALPEGYIESSRWGMIAYEVPLEVSGPTYNGQPLLHSALAAQKRHYALYLTGVYADPGRAEDFRRRYLASGCRLDMGKSCVRFRRLEDLPIPLISETIGALEVDVFLELVRRARNRR
jgi:hypothetical protein